MTVENVPDWAMPAVDLWIRKANRGERYLSGRWGGVRVFIFRNPRQANNKKKGDYVLCFARPSIETDKISEPNPSNAS